MPTAFVLNEHDRAVLLELLRRARQVQGAPTGRLPAPEEDLPAPEVYVGLTPAGGIPALIGTAPAKPGKAECQVYRVDTKPTGPELEEVKNLVRDVHNLTGAALPGNDWVLLARDKWGTWFAVTGGGGAGAEVVRVSSSTPDANGYFDGFLQTFNVTTRTWVDAGPVKIRDANG
jgi:hypothetical protein